MFRRSVFSAIGLRLLSVVLLSSIVLVAPSAPPALAQEILWTRQFGTAAADQAFGVAADGSGVYVVGYSPGTAFIRKYDVSGNEVWTRQFAAYAEGVTADGSGAYVVGYTWGTLPGQSTAGERDAFIRKYDVNGNEVWTRQFGTASWDQALGVAADGSGVYVVGLTQGALPGQSSSGGLIDAFIRKYDVSGNEVWTKQFGTTSDDEAIGVAADGSGVYVVGYTRGTLAGQINPGGLDAFIRKYDVSGNEVWTRQFRSPVDVAMAVTADASGVYVVGYIFGTLPGQNIWWDFWGGSSADAFIRKYDANGNVVWTRQFGTTSDDYLHGVAADASGVYVVGYTQGDVANPSSSAGDWDAFIRKYDLNGNEVWTSQFGTAADDYAFGVVANKSDVYIVGGTGGALPNQSSAGGTDAFILKIRDNSAPVVGPISVSAQTVEVHSAVYASASFTDANVWDSHTASWNWGDGTPPSPGTVTEANGSGSVTGSHTYTAAGIYSPTLTVADPAGATGQSVYQYVVVYNPQGGFVSGAGLIDSPPGAYLHDPSLKGMASFAFVSSYKKGANVPTGNTMFEFQAAGLDFKSTSYDWLVVNQNYTTAQFKGAGTLNGQMAPNGSPYHFMLWAGDGTPDTFRIKIWWDNPLWMLPVYDNGTDQAISNGSIVIHK